MATDKLRVFITPQVIQFLNALDEAFPEKSAEPGDTMEHLQSYGGKRILIRHLLTISKDA